MSSNSVCNHTTRSSDFVNHLYDYRPNWTPLNPVTITNQVSAKKGLTVGVHHFGINPLSPNNDQHQFSPKDIHRLSTEMVLRINKTITKEKMP